jgi:hypothetical protein
MENTKLDKSSFNSVWVARLENLEEPGDKIRYGKTLIQAVKENGWHKDWGTGKKAKKWYQELLRDYAEQ